MPDSSYSTTQHNVLKNDLIAPLIKEQFPDFFKEEDSKLPLFLEKYYEYMECIQIHYTDRILDEYKMISEDDAIGGILLEDDINEQDTLILESLRTDDSTFVVEETITGQTSGATGVVRGVQEKGQLAGKHTMTDPHHIFVLPKSGKFIKGEKILGSANRVTATIGSIDDKGATGLSRELLNVADVYNTDEEFLEVLRKEFIPNIPKTAKTNLKKLIPLAKDVYQNRGNESSFKFLWRSVYDQDDLEFLYPKDYIFKVSGSNWTAETILFCNRATATNSGNFAGRRITGVTSKATAIVQQISGFIRGKYDLVQLFLTDLNGTFITGETVESEVTADGVKASAITLASLSNITVVDGGTSYKVGDALTIAGGGGFGATATVNTVTDGAVNDVIISDGGDGYVGSELFQYFTAAGDTGVGAASKAISFIQSGSAKVYGNTITVSTFASTQIDSANYGGDLSGHNANTHFHSNANNTFDITVGSSANYATGQFVCDSANNIIGTVIAVPDATSIIYALEDDTKPNFYPGTNGSSISAYLSDGSAVASTTTTVTAVAVVSDSQYFGALTLQEIPYGTLTGSEIITVGRDFQARPTITASQNAITTFNNDDGILGPRTRFLNLASNTQFLFTAGKQVQGETSGAAGTILDPYIDSLGNSTFSALRFKPDSVEIVVDSTDGSADAGDNILLEDGFHPSHGSYSGTTSFNGKFRLEDLAFASGETILQVGTTANAVAASSNTVSIDNSFRGNNAVIQAGNLSIGSITSVQITDFGVGFTSAPSIDTSTAGDGNAILTTEIGSVVQKAGEYTNEDSLLSGKDKIQDSYYYQDYSYVLKTDLPVKNFRDTVKSFIHPAGWALFGEISVVSNLTSEFAFDTNRPFTLQLDITPFSVNFLDANTDLTQFHINFIEGIASISFTPTYDNEFIYRIKESVPIDVSMDINSTAIEHIEYELPLNVTHASHSRINHVETQRTLAAQASVAMTRSVWEKIGTSAFAEAGSQVIRTMPTIQDWYNTYQIPSQGQTVTIETLYNQEINILAGSQYEPKVKKDDEIFIPSIDSVLESNGKLLLTGGSDDGDDILLEDGVAPGEGSYTSSTSAHGFLLAESDRIVYEDNTSLNRNGIPYWQKEEAKYIVKSSNSTSFTVTGAGHSNYLPVGLHDFNTEAFLLRNRS